MSSIVTDQGIVHYESVGRGKPVILLHGWIGSWRVWYPLMESLSRSHRTYALDFWGFGESGKKRDSYDINDFVSLVAQFMEQLGIVEAPIIGHSMGGTVALKVALAYPRRVSKVAVVASPIVGSALSPLLIAFGYRPFAWLSYNVPVIFRLGLRIASPFLSKNPDYYAMQSHDLSRTTLESFSASIASLRDTDIRHELHRLTMPVLGVFGTRDNIVNPNQAQALAAAAPHAQVEVIAGARHFPMLDEPDKLAGYVNEFLREPQNAASQPVKANGTA